MKRFQQRGQPVISVDTKKKELVGPSKNGGREWHPAGEPEHVQVLGVWIATLIHCCQEIRPWILAPPFKSNSERNRLPRVAVVLEVQSKQGPK